MDAGQGSDPIFFSTKFVGRAGPGSGQKCAAEGRIMVDSSPGKGSTFTVLLPPGVLKPAIAKCRHIGSELDRHNIESAKPVVRQMMGVVLKRAGCKCGPQGTANSPQHIERQQNSISLVLLDMGMPQVARMSSGDASLRVWGAGGYL
jgi:hypothetical protein